MIKKRLLKKSTGLIIIGVLTVAMTAVVLAAPGRPGGNGNTEGNGNMGSTGGKGSMQEMQGDHTICAGFAGIKKGLLTLANPFSGEDFKTVDLDALDAVGEFVNCVNGLFASELSTDGVDVDMLPPAFYDKPCRISGDQFIVLPIHIDGKVLYFVLAVDAKWEVENLNAEEV